MSTAKQFLYKNTLVRHKYLKGVYKAGVTFEEFCDYHYDRRVTGEKVVESTLFGVRIKRNNTFWYVQNVEELFIDEVYKFSSLNREPVIIDCGSNIGLSIIYFKRLFPEAKIIGFEPDRNIYNVCVHNLNAFKYSDVEMINAAVWKKDGEISFLADNSLGGKIVDKSDDSLNYTVNSVQLKKYINTTIDFLKIDIEGAEFEVIKDCADVLCNVKNLFIEYHSQGASKQNLQEILKIVSDSGFRYYIKEAWNNMKHPFIDSVKVNEMFYDLQLNIFAYR